MKAKMTLLEKLVGIGSVLFMALLGFRILTFYYPEIGVPENLRNILRIEEAPVPYRPAEEPKMNDWPFAGNTGTFDMAANRRGLQVYQEVCAACHGLDLIAFRTLNELGYSEDAALEIAQAYQIEDGPDEFGDMFMRAGRLSDYFPNPFPNENAAKAANGGKAPPDLSLMVKARMGGPNHLYSILTGYGETPPADFVPNSDFTSYNPYFEGWEILMPEPLFDGQVEYADGTEATADQMAKDVVNFLAWTAFPEHNERHQMGLKVILYMLVLTILLFLSKRLIWRRVKK